MDSKIYVCRKVKIIVIWDRGNIYSLHPILIDIFLYVTMTKIISVFINLLFFIEGDFYHTPY